MNTDKRFYRYYRKKFINKNNKLYFKILTLSMLFSLTILIYFANLNYRKNYQTIRNYIKKRYVNLILSLPENRTEKITEKSAAMSQAKKTISTKEYIKKQLDNDKILNEINKNINTLPVLEDIDDNYDDILQGINNDINNYNNYFHKKIKKRITDTITTDIDVYYMISHPFAYKLNRRGSIYIKVPDDLLIDNEREKIGYRNQDEISRVIKDNLDKIEYCYQKAKRLNHNLRGFVKFEFRISYEGYIIASSIRILDSTIKDKKVENCIKKTLSRIRTFKKLDKKMGIAKVVQKFSFN